MIDSYVYRHTDWNAYCLIIFFFTQALLLEPLSLLRCSASAVFWLLVYCWCVVDVCASYYVTVTGV